MTCPRLRPFRPAPAVVGLLAALLATAPGGCGFDREFRPDPRHAAVQPAPAPAPARPDSLLVVSYNIQYGEDVALAVDDLRAAGLDRPDILLLQEMTPGGVDTVARALDLGYVYQPASVHPHHGRPFGNAVLSRWPIEAHRLLVLPHAHPVTGHRRVALACDLNVAGTPVRAVSLHLATAVLATALRVDQAAAVLDSLVVPWPGALVIGGDFNTAGPHDVATVRRMYRRDGRLHPAHLPNDCTVRGHPWRLLGAGCRLDHLFLRGLDDGATGIATGSEASDHFPVWARVGWSTRPAAAIE
jgi:endonuclease/exonuclease/phosphatase family metal-dependent hydrolase